MHTGARLAIAFILPLPFLFSCPATVGHTLKLDRGISLPLPAGWSAVSSGGGAVELVHRRPVSNVIDGHLVLTTEVRRSHAGALQRLREIAAESPAPSSFVAVDAWPALERRQEVPMPRLEDQKTPKPRDERPLKLLKITIAVAANDLLVRFEGDTASDSPPSVADGLTAIGRGLTFGDRADAARTASEIDQLKRTTPAAPSGVVPQAPGSIEPTPTPGSAINGAVFVQEGIGEIEVAVSKDGNNVVVASNDGIAFSSNGGATFTSVAWPITFPHDGDPSLTRGLSGNFYFASITAPNGTPAAGNVSGCADSVSVSTNGGQSFNFLQHAVLCPSTGNPQCFPDQEHIAADAFTPGPGGKDQLYVVWRNFVGQTNCPGAGSVTPKIVCSKDGGVTWTAPVPAGIGDHPRVAVGPDGSVYVIYNSGNNVTLNKFSSCANGLVKQANFPATVAAGVTMPQCPAAGIDRCSPESFLSPMVAADSTNANHVYVAWAANTATNNDDIFLADSTDGGQNFTRTVKVNAAVHGRRFMPWLCTAGATANVGWYDRREGVVPMPNPKGTTNDLTAFYRGSASVQGQSLAPGKDVNVSRASDPQCASGWGVCGSGYATSDSESCTVQPQLAGYCLNAMGNGSRTRCDFDETTCPTGETCKIQNLCPKYGDYNGIACGDTHVYSAWASATRPVGVAVAPAGLNVYVDGLCGLHDQLCCSGAICGARLNCVNGRCSCGALNQFCCNGTCTAGLTCVNLICVQKQATGSCAKCGTNLQTCLNGCKTDPKHLALCNCLCANTACDCQEQNSCGPCQFQSCPEFP